MKTCQSGEIVEHEGLTALRYFNKIINPDRFFITPINYLDQKGFLSGCGCLILMFTLLSFGIGIIGISAFSMSNNDESSSTNNHMNIGLLLLTLLPFMVGMSTCCCNILLGGYVGLKGGIKMVWEPAVFDYLDKRANGTREDNPSWDFPKDGSFEMIESENSISLVYLEGSRDRAWMAERDRNYLFRLRRVGRLDTEEPSLEHESPALYAEVVSGGCKDDNCNRPTSTVIFMEDDHHYGRLFNHESTSQLENSSSQLPVYRPATNAKTHNL